MPREISKQGFVNTARNYLESMREKPTETGVTVANFDELVDDLSEHYEEIKEKGEPTTVSHLWKTFKEKHGLTSRKEFVERAFWLTSIGEEKSPGRIETQIEQDLETIFPGVAIEAEVTTEGVTVSMPPFYTELKPGRGMPVASGRIYQYPNPLQKILARKYFENFTEESIEKAAEKEEMSLEKARELAKEAAEKGEAIAEVEEARAEAEEASEQAEFLRSTLEDKEEEMEDLQEKIDWLNEQRLAPERVDELEGEMTDLRGTVDDLTKEVNEIELKSTGFGYGTPAESEEIEKVRKDIDRVEETVLDFSNEMNRLETDLTETLRALIEQLTVPAEEAMETLGDPPEVLENIVETYPEMKRTPIHLAKRPLAIEFDTFEDFLAYVENNNLTGPKTASWDEFTTYLDSVQGVDLVELGEFNRKAETQEKPPKRIFGHFISYIDWKQKGHEVPTGRMLSPMESELRDFVADVITEEKPELKPRSIWRTVRDDVDEDASLEENKQTIKVELDKIKGIEFPEKKEEKKAKRQTVKEFVKKNIKEKTDKNPENVWNGLEVFYRETETINENIETMKEKMSEQFNIKTFLEGVR